MKKLILLLAGLFLLPAVLFAQHAIVGETVYPVSDDPIDNGVVLIEDGEIAAVGTQDEITIPDNFERHEAGVVTPGFIDSRTVVGLNGIYNVEDDQDALETSDPIQPELRAFDAFNPREDLVDWVRSLGVTTVHTGHAPGATMSGQTMLIKTHGNSVGDAIMDSLYTVSMTLGAGVSGNFSSPGTRSKNAAMIRQEFIRTQEYMENGRSRDLGMETLSKIMDNEIPAMIMAQRDTEIMTALRIADEFDIDIILSGAAEAYKVKDYIIDAGVPVFIHPTMIRTGGETENASFETAAKLYEAGVPVFFQSGFEGYVPKTRVVSYEAAIAVRNGFPREAALESLTLGAAEFLGIDDRVGSLEEGKDADIALFEDDPFEYTSRTCMVFIDGEVVSDECL